MRRLYLIALISTAIFLGLSDGALASEASMRLSPATGMYTEGSSFKVDVAIDTDGNPINAAEGRMAFDPQMMRVSGIEFENSILTYWTNEPDFSNELGVIEFVGATASGFEGFEGKIMTINFVATGDGVARVRFNSGAIIADDGRGSNIISSLMSGAYTLTPDVVEFFPSPEDSAPDDAPEAPVVTSETHPDPENWYSENTVDLSWDTPEDITASRMVLDRNPNTRPQTQYNEPITERTFRFLEDGAWYFHLQLQNSNGWSNVSTFKIQIDTQQPERFNIKMLPNEDPTKPRTRLLFDAFDKVSGIERYEIQFSTGKEEGKIKTWMNSGDQIYTTPPLEPGNYTIIAKAIDGAGNHLVDMEELEVKSIDPPVFDEVSKVLNSNSTLTLEGSAKPNSEIFILMKKDGSEPQEYSTEANSDGRFMFIAPKKPEDGVYEIQAYAVDERGAKSELSRTATVGVNAPGVARFGSAALNTVSFAIPLSASVFVLIVLLLYLKHKFMLFQNRLKKEVEGAETEVHRAFMELKDEVDRNVRSLERVKSSRDLTREEVDVMDSLKGRLVKAEKIFEKEMDKIEKIANYQTSGNNPVEQKVAVSSEIAGVQDLDLRKEKDSPQKQKQTIWKKPKTMLRKSA